MHAALQGSSPPCCFVQLRSMKAFGPPSLVAIKRMLIKHSANTVSYSGVGSNRFLRTVESLSLNRDPMFDNVGTHLHYCIDKGLLPPRKL